MSEPRRRFSFNPFTWGSQSEELEANKDEEITNTVDKENDSLMYDSTMTGSSNDNDNDNAIESDDDEDGREKSSSNQVEKSGGNSSGDNNDKQEPAAPSDDDHLHPQHHSTYPTTESESEPRRSFSRWRFSRHQTLQPNHNNSTPSSSPQRPESIEFDLPPLDPVVLEGYTETTKTRLLDETLTQQLRDMLPDRLQLYTSWNLCYSLEQHGASLHTLYSNVIPKPQKRPGYIIIIKDKHGDIFGAYANEYFHTIESRRYYGNGECFLWKTTRLPNNDIRFQAFPYTGVNDFVIFCAPNYLSMGGGDGHYGLWIDDNLEHGVSSRSITFGNENLSSETNFYVVALEVWSVGPS